MITTKRAKRRQMGRWGGRAEGNHNCPSAYLPVVCLAVLVMSGPEGAATSLSVLRRARRSPK